MPKKSEQTTDDILRDLMIIQLALAGVPGAKIREIVGVSMDRVTRIVKHLKNARD